METSTGPTLAPPSPTVTGGATGTTAPDPAMDGAVTGTITIEPGLPTQQPAAVSGAGADAVTATWRNGVTVDALFCVNETRNAWVRLVGVGWKKIYNGRDGAFVALTTLAAQARQTGRTMNVREEADGMIYEIYLW